MESPKKPFDEARTFFKTLFDFSFSKFITVQMFPALYGIILAASLVGVCYYTFSAFLDSFWKGLFYLTVASPVAFIAIAAITRALMEFYIVVFKMAENIDEMRISTEKFSGITDTMDGVRDLTKKLPFWNLVGSSKNDERKDRKDKDKEREKEREKDKDVEKDKEKPRKVKDVNWPY